MAVDYDPEMASPSAKYRAKEAFVLQARAVQHQQQMKQQQQQLQPTDDAYTRALASHDEPGAGWRVSRDIAPWYAARRQPLIPQT